MAREESKRTLGGQIAKEDSLRAALKSLGIDISQNRNRLRTGHGRDFTDRPYTVV